VSLIEVHPYNRACQIDINILSEEMELSLWMKHMVFMVFIHEENCCNVLGLNSSASNPPCCRIVQPMWMWYCGWQTVNHSPFLLFDVNDFHALQDMTLTATVMTTPSQIISHSKNLESQSISSFTKIIERITKIYDIK